jgi:serine protease Do
MNELPFIVASTPVEKVVDVKVIRKGKEKTFKVKIGELEEQKEPEAAAREKSDLGMTVEEITPNLARQFGLSEESGLVVVQVEGNSPAEEAGIKPGDLILEVDQDPLRNLDDYKKKIRQYEQDDTILLLVKRGGATLYLTLTVWE